MKAVSPNPRRILLIRMSAIGDIILTLPVIAALKARWEKAEIDYVTSAEFAELVRGHPGVSQVWPFDRASGFAGLRRLRKELGEQGYDLIVDLHHNFRSTYLRWRGGAPMNRVYRKHHLGRRLLARPGWKINLLKNSVPVCDRYFTALEDFGISRESRRPLFHLDDTLRQEGRKLLAEAGIGDTERVLAAAPGANYPTKCWPIENYAAAITGLAAGGEKVLLVGGRRDRSLAAALTASLSRQGLAVADFTGRLSLLLSAAVMARASLLLTNDSGLMHMAEALDVPLVAVFGPTSRELGFYPLSEKSCVVEVPLPCRPCTLHGDLFCPRDHHACMRMITPELVIAAGRELLATEKKRESPEGGLAGA